MGADTVHTYKKMIPRFLVAFTIWLVSFGIIVFMYDGPTWAPLWIAGSGAILIGYLCLEALHAQRLVKGAIENVAISDLTRAIYWLSSAGSGKVESSINLVNCTVVQKTLEKINGEMQVNWEKIVQEYPFPNLNMKKFVALALGGVACAFAGIFLGVFLHIPLLGFALIGLMILLLIMTFSRLAKPLEMANSLISDPEAVKTSRWLAQQLINWTSERIKKPLKVVLLDDNYSTVRLLAP